MFFDCAMQHHNCDVGVAGKTTSLSHSLPPARAARRTLHASTIDRPRSDERITSTGQLFDGDRLLCEVEMEAVAGDRAALPEVSPRRSAP